MFKHILSYVNFAREVRRNSRFVRSQEAEEFLQTVAETLKAREVPVPAGKTLFRAQLGCEISQRPVDEDHEVEEEVPYGAARMIPLPDRAREGRVSPHGIPCLYLATDRETALGEVRPWIGSQVSMGYFKTTRDLLVVDCSRYHQQPGFWHYLMNTPVGDVERTPEPEEVQRAIWGDIDHEFSRPVTRNDDMTDYAPTQILAELFKNKGMDGLAYKSALSENGFNIALFDLQAAKIQACELLEVDKVQFSFVERGSAWHSKNQ